MIISEPAESRQELRIASWNANSCRGAKEGSIYASMNDIDNKIDILCIQESHWTDCKLPFNKTRYRDLYLHYNHGTQATRGVLTCIRINSVQHTSQPPLDILPAALFLYPSLQSGRVTVSRINFCHSSYTLVNLYCPNNLEHRKEFFQWLSDKPSHIPGPFIYAGD